MTDKSKNHLNEKIPVGVSACLTGERVRYDGNHERNDFVMGKLADYFEYRTFCPEVYIGLGVPRPTIQLELQEGKTRCIASADKSKDYTQPLIECADEQSPWQEKIYAYIFKSKSPSCGLENVKRFREGELYRDGTGIYAARLQENFPSLPVIEESDLETEALRDKFIQDVLKYYCESLT